MDISSKTVDGVVVVALRGELDGKTASPAQQRILPLIPPGGKMLLDMTEVGYMSSAGLRMMLLLYRQALAMDSRIALVGLSEEIEDTMSATGFLEFFTVSGDLPAGLTALAQSA